MNGALSFQVTLLGVLTGILAILALFDGEPGTGIPYVPALASCSVVLIAIGLGAMR
jgi:hypothetical protein